VSSTPTSRFYLPRIWEEITDSTNFYDWQFLRPLIGRRIFWASVDWQNCDQLDLPSGYVAYVVKTEGPNLNWIERQAQKIDAPIFFAAHYKDYGALDHLTNVFFIPVLEGHYMVKNMIDTYDTKIHKQIRYKVSALVHRATQNKILALSSLAKDIGLDQCIISLHNIEEKNVHNWQDCGNETLDEYLHYFIKHFKNKTFKPDDIDLSTQLAQWNFQHPAYLNSAININNESFHYSHMMTDSKSFINPGPFITEKTYKCILSETAFINNGQYDCYDTLISLGFKFDYGLDLSYDKDPANLDRMCKMIDLIKTLNNYDAMEIFLQTRESCLYNKDYIMSGDLFRLAESVNQRGLEQILAML
jgi:hypothetical protein